MHEIMIKSHLIVTDIHSEYHIRWLGRMIDIKPELKNGKPIFIVVGGGGRMELNTTDMLRVEKCAKLVSQPKGRGAVSTDTTRIYIREVDDTERLMGILTHDRVKEYSQMYDKVYQD